MKGRRWNQEEDQLLKKEVLHSIQNGGTQLDAFAAVGKKLGRTPGACGFRWNAVLRQNDPSSYQEAKQKRVFLQLERQRGNEIKSFSQLFPILEQLDRDWLQLNRDIKELTDQLQVKKAKFRELFKENQQLKEQKHTFRSYRQEVKERYQELLRLFKTLKQQIHPEENRESVQTRADTKLDSTT